MHFQITAAAIAALSPLAAGDPVFYTIDRTTRELITVDASTGETAAVGAIDADVAAVYNLDWLDGRLMLVADVAGVESLLEIDPATAGVLSSVAIGIPGGDNLEGFAVVKTGPDAGQMWIGHGPAPTADTLSVLEPDGSIGASATLPPPTDLDRLEWDESAGAMLVADGEPAGSIRVNAMGTVSFDAGYSETGSTETHVDDALGGLAFAPDGSLWAINNRLPEIARIDKATAERLEVIELDLPRAVMALAIAGPGPCNAADLTEPFGTLDLDDITAFIGAFKGQDSAADLDGNGLFDLSDINLFVSLFQSGCP